MLRSTEYSILHRNERFMKKAVILYVPWTLSAYSLLFFQMSVLRFLFPPRRAGRTGRLCGRAAAGATPLCAGCAPAAGHPLFRRRHAQLLTPAQAERLIRAAEPVPGAEITLEANPETVTEESLRGFRAAGVNRISFGVQSARDTQLRTLGRPHSAKQRGQPLPLPGAPDSRISAATSCCAAPLYAGRI